MEISIDYKLKNQIDVENLYRNNNIYHMFDILIKITRNIAIALFVFNLIFYFILPNYSVENIFLGIKSGISVVGIIALIFTEFIIAFFAIGFYKMMKDALNAFAPVASLSKMEESMNIVDNKLIYSYKQNIFSPINQRTFLAIDLSRIYSIDYDESSHEIVIDGYMEERTLEYSPVLETVKFEEMRHNTTKLYDYYSPSLYVILNQYK